MQSDTIVTSQDLLEAATIQARPSPRSPLRRSLSWSLLNRRTGRGQRICDHAILSWDDWEGVVVVGHNCRQLRDVLPPADGQGPPAAAPAASLAASIIDPEIQPE